MNKKVLNILLSAVFAFILWFYVSTVVSPNSEKVYSSIPVVIDDSVLHERGLTVTNKEGHKVRLNVVGNRIDLKKTNSDNFKVTVDLSRVYKAGTHELPYEIEFSDQLNLRIDKITPGTIKLDVEAYISKKIFVEPIYNGELDPGFEADKENISMDYKEIWVTGPASSIDNVEIARIQLDLKGQTESIVGRFPITLHDKKGKVVNDALIECQANEVDVALKILRTKELMIEFKEIIYGAGATKETCEIKFEPKSILISGNNAVIDTIPDVHIIPETLDLTTISDGYTKTYPINLDPKVTNKYEITEVTVTVTFPELDTVDLKIDEVEYINLPAGVAVEVTNLPITLTLRGPKDVIQQLNKDTDVKVKIDCSGIKVGDSATEILPQVECVHQGVGVLNPKKVPVSVSEAKAIADEPEGHDTGVTP